MTDSVVIIGNVGSEPKSIVTKEGVPLIDFRLASTPRLLDRATGEWRDGATNWYSVKAFRQLAQNVQASIQKGDRVIVSGRLAISQWERDGRSGTNVEIVADAVGPDLARGTARYTRNSSSAGGQGEGRREVGDGIGADAPGEVGWAPSPGVADGRGLSATDEPEPELVGAGAAAIGGTGSSGSSGSGGSGGSGEIETPF